MGFMEAFKGIRVPKYRIYVVFLSVALKSYNLDEQYFLRAASAGTRFFQPKTHDLDPETLTSHDPLLTMMIAMELYKEFIQGEIRKLEEYFFVAK